MASAPEPAMDKALLKRLLNHSTEQPVSCAFGTTKEGAQILVDKIKNPKVLEKDLAKLFPDIANTRFGHATVPEDDPKLVRIVINRAASGAARRLAKALKGTGFKKVELLLEDGSVSEGAETEDEEAAGDGKQGQAEKAPPPHDAAMLTRALVALIAQIKSVNDPAQRASLVKLAVAAETALKGGDLNAAEAALRELSHAEAGARAGATPKVRAIWLTAKEQIDGSLERLAQELRSYDDPDLEQIANFGLFGVSGGRETVSLTTALMEFESAPPDRQVAAKAKLQQAVDAYKTMLTGNPLVQMVDDNPFDVKVGLQETLGGALRQIEQALA